LEEKKLTEPINKELSRVEQLLETGKYQEALNCLAKIMKGTKIAANNQLACMVLESRIQIKRGDLEKALVLVDEVLLTDPNHENLFWIIDALIVKAEIYWRSGKLDEGLRVIAEGIGQLEGIEVEQAKRQEKQIKQRQGELFHQEGVIHWFKGELDKALECHQQSLKIKEQLGNKPGIANSLNNLGLVFWSKGDFNQAREYYQQSLKINEELGNRDRIAVILSNLGNLLARTGDLGKAMEYQKQALAIKEELGNKQEIFTTLINIGVIYQLKGELNQALEYYQRSLTLSEESGINKDIALAKNNLGSIFQLKGNLDEALESFQQSLAIYKKLGMKENIALLLLNIGEIYRQKGALEKALEHYQPSLVMYEEVGNTPYTAIVLSELVWVALEMKNSTLVQQYLQKLQQINETTLNRVIDQRYRIANALSLKASTRTRHKMKAGEILEQVIKEEIVDHSLTVTAMIHLCDLLLSELKMTGEEELFLEIKDLTTRLLDIAEQQTSHSLLAQTYLLQSKLALIELNMGRAKKLLTDAFTIAQDKGLESLARIITQEQDNLLSQLQKWESLIEQNPSRQELISLSGIDGFLEKMIQTTVANLMEEQGVVGTTIPRKEYQLVFLDLLKDSPKTEQTKFRVGIAQIGLSQAGNLLQEFYTEQAPGLFGLRENKLKLVRAKIKSMVEKAASQKLNLLIFPELSIDLNYDPLRDDLLAWAKTYNLLIIPGSYHNFQTKQNQSVVISPEGILWEQTKHIPANIQFEQKRITEGIEPRTPPHTTIIGNTEFGRIAIVICRDFLDMDLRVELKNFEPPVDLIINPAFTPVTADFRAAHFDARRSIYAYCFFANVAEFGDSLIYTPEKEREERTIPPREENLIYKEIDLFKLRTERKKWEIKHRKQRPFIQSTR
jgi:tetratricopeptide (TPR) repeat protein/predicted amidohydrolase